VGLGSKFSNLQNLKNLSKLNFSHFANAHKNLKIQLFSVKYKDIDKRASLKPFKLNLWLAFLFVFALFCLKIRQIQQYSPHFKTKNH